jgi:transcriptional regulator with XRE-family HTH domain
MGELGERLRRARQQAGLSLAGMARRTGYSRGYLGNVETGERHATPDVIQAYERVLDDSVNRRQLLLGSVATLAASSTDDAAASIAHEIRNQRSGLLTQIQTSRETDKAIASMVGGDTPSLASLTKWARRGSAVIRVNAVGILAKVGSPLVDTEAITVLRADAEVRELYLTAVLGRVLALPRSMACSYLPADRV